MYIFIKICYQIHEKNEDHKLIIVFWEARHFPQGNIISIEQYIWIMLDKEQKKNLTVVKCLYFIIQND